MRFEIVRRIRANRETRIIEAFCAVQYVHASPRKKKKEKRKKKQDKDGRGRHPAPCRRGLLYD
jgi:hypothetical protein